MKKMKSVRRFLKKAFSSVTILVIPHDHIQTLNLKVPVAILVSTLLLAVVGGIFLVNFAVSGIRYRSQHDAMAAKVDYYNDQFSKWNSTVQTLQSAGKEFQHLFSLESKEDVLEKVDTDFAGSLELPDLINELEKTRQNVEGIKEYLRVERDIFAATPRGYPVPGRLTSSYGKRQDPLGAGIRFHSGIDLACDKGTPIKATADGIVSHSGWTAGSGQVVVLEHGLGFSTIYAHNSKNAVKVGQTVRKGDIIGYVGSTGRATGPHLHYEIWKEGKNVNPHTFLSGKGT
ncbi:MAG: M23 family metallopeptidase [Acidobacteriota bacterium]|jgi:murein DD-endopeptidase MepM/ murein hydrolase activator NlpD|nr:M23 family metallopeptidase [Acidobacteriota bacterium]